MKMWRQKARSGNGDATKIPDPGKPKKKSGATAEDCSKAEEELPA
jgi:hypothetical protein